MIINYSDYKKIQEMKSKGFNACQTYKKLGYTNYITYKLWNMTEDEFNAFVGLSNDKIDKYKDFIIEELKTHPDIRSSTILDHIKEKNNLIKLNFSNAVYYRYMKVLRKQYGFKQTKDYRVYHMESDKEPGEEAQVDMGEMRLASLNGGMVKVYFFVMVLSYSRMKYVYFNSTPFTTISFIKAHDYAFRYFGGRCKTIRYDQDRIMIVSENAGNIVYVKEFKKYLDEVGFNVYLCKKQDPDGKGKVENAVKFIKTSFLDSRIYYGIDNLNQECLKWLDRTGNEIISSATFKIPREVFNNQEAKYLIKYDHERITLTNQRVCNVNKLSDIMYKYNFYQLPIGKYDNGSRVRVEESNNTLFIYDIDTNELICSHALLKGKGNRSPLEIKVKVPKVFTELKEEYVKVRSVIKFLDNIALSNPRYLKEQCYLLKKVFKEYDKEEVYEIIRKCNSTDTCDVSDILSHLIVKHGIESSKDVLPRKASSFYKAKATILSKYDILLEDK